MCEPTVRVGTARDALLLGRLLHEFNAEFGADTPEPEQVAGLARAQLESGEIAVLFGDVTDSGGEGPADGFAQLRFHLSLYSPGPDACLEELWVRPGSRGHGLGRALLRAAMALARDRGATRIELNTSVDDVAARGLYSSMGFTNDEGGPGGPAMLYYEREL